jgi:hypothetical protein
MPLLRRTRPAPAPAPGRTRQAEPSHTLVPLVDAMPAAWPVHARRCLQHLPDRLRWARPLLDPEHPGEIGCTPDQARDVVLWLHHLPSYEQLIVGCHKRRPA